MEYIMISNDIMSEILCFSNKILESFTAKKYMYSHIIYIIVLFHIKMITFSMFLQCNSDVITKITISFMYGKCYVYCVNKMPFKYTKCFADNMGITNGCNF